MNKLLLVFTSLLTFFSAYKKTGALSTNVYSEMQLHLLDENGVNVIDSKLTSADLDLYYVKTIPFFCAI